MAYDWRKEWAKRPWWMNLMFGFCLYMTFKHFVPENPANPE